MASEYNKSEKLCSNYVYEELRAFSVSKESDQSDLNLSCK